MKRSMLVGPASLQKSAEAILTMRQNELAYIYDLLPLHFTGKERGLGGRVNP